MISKCDTQDAGHVSALVELLDLAGFRPLVVTVDDIQNVELVRRLDSVPVILLLTTPGEPTCGNSPWVAEVLLDAARHELSEDRWEAAARYLTTAKRTSAGGEIHAKVTLLLAQAEWLSNPALAVRHLDDLVEAASSGHLDTEESAVLLRMLLWFGRGAQARDILQRSRTVAQSDLRDVEMWLASAYPPLHRWPPTGSSSSRHTKIDEDPWLRSAAALAGFLAGGRADEIVTRVERVLRHVYLDHNTPWCEEVAIIGLHGLLRADRADLASTWCDRLTDEGPRHGAVWRAMILAVRAEIALRNCDIDATVDHGTQAIAELSERGWGVAIALPLSILVLAHTRAGDHRQAARYLSRPIPEAALASRFGIHYLHARGQHFLATNRSHAALMDFTSCGELIQQWRLDFSGLVPWRTSAAEACLSLESPDQAETFLNEELKRQGGTRSRDHGICLRVLAATKPAGQRLAPLREAAEILEECGDQFELARALMDLCSAYRQLGDPRRAHIAARRAWHVARIDQIGPDGLEAFPELAECCEPAQPEGAVQAPRNQSLTDGERRVASLATFGYTNREIASRLFVTESTVEQHLTRIYRKCKIRRRADLPAVLHDSAAAG